MEKKCEVSLKYRSVDGALLEIQPIADVINESLALLALNKKQIASLVRASQFVIVDQTQNSVPKNSPSAKPSGSVKIKSIKKLRENYLVVQNLFAAIKALETVEANIRATMANMPKADKSLQEIASLKNKAMQGMADAFRFLGDLALNHEPAAFTKLTNDIAKALELSVSYEDARIYKYVYEVDGNIVFSTYIQMNNLVSESGVTIPSLLVVISYRTGNDPAYYINTLKTFEPPSDDVLVKRISTVKDALHSINMLMALDGFSNSLGSVPLKQLLKRSVDKNTFSDYTGYVQSVDVESNSITFNFKATVNDETFREVLKRLFLDVKASFKNTSSKMRVDSNKVGKKWQATFYFVRPNDLPAIQEDDLGFLKNRFGMPEEHVTKILKLVNSSSHKRILREFETARIKGTDEYNWYKYVGQRTITIGTKRVVELVPNDVFGLRMSSNGKDVRLVKKDLGLTKVVTLSVEDLKTIENKAKKVRARVIADASVAYPCQKLEESLLSVRLPRDIVECIMCVVNAGIRLKDRHAFDFVATMPAAIQTQGLEAIRKQLPYLMTHAKKWVVDDVTRLSAKIEAWLRSA